MCVMGDPHQSSQALAAYHQMIDKAKINHTRGLPWCYGHQYKDSIMFTCWDCDLRLNCCEEQQNATKTGQTDC